jgi:glycine dehydrogenase subunit 1
MDRPATDHVPITSDDQRRMLARIGVPDMETLIRRLIPETIPRAHLPQRPGLSEPELIRHCKELAEANRTALSLTCFLGAGAYEHFIPSVVRYIVSRGEFLTAYTPYQAEASQGTLQAMYEFQSMLCDITGMDVANASLYDGASALAEACLLALRHTERDHLLLSEGLHPEYRETVRTYLKGTAVRIEELPLDQGVSSLKEARARLSNRTAALAIQHPNALGCLEPVEPLAELAHASGALVIASVYPIALGILKPPGAWGADIVVGEGQPLGIPLQYGGPYLGLFATRQFLLRKVPGRIVGLTRDAQNRRGFVLTLQAREQHIRRARATSNICTNEAMMALAAAVTLAALGKVGFRELAIQNLQKAHYAFDRLREIPGVRPMFPQPFFNEFALEMPKDPEEIHQSLLQKGFLAGLPLARWNPRWSSGWLVCVTETRTRQQIDRLVEAVRKELT